MRKEFSSTHPPQLRIRQFPPPSTSTQTHFITMSYNGHFDFTGFTSFDNNNVGCGNSGAVDDLFNIFQEENNTSLGLFNNQYAGPSTADETWYLQSQETGCTSQSYTGAEVFGDLSCFPDLGHNTIATGTQCQGNGAAFDEGRSCMFSVIRATHQKLIHLSQATTHSSALGRFPLPVCRNRRQSPTTTPLSLQYRLYPAAVSHNFSSQVIQIHSPNIISPIPRPCVERRINIIRTRPSRHNASHPPLR